MFGEGGGSSSGESKPRGKNSGLMTRARKMAKEIHLHPLRIMGLLGNGGKNRKWAAAVARCILLAGVGDGVMKKWQSKIPRDLSVDRAAYCRNVLNTLRVWGYNEVEVEEGPDDPCEEGVVRVDRGVVVSEGSSSDDSGEEGRNHEGSDAFCKVLISSCIAASIRSKGVCPFCLFDEIRGAQCRTHVTFQGYSPREMTDEDLYMRLATGAINNGWLEAAALSHNRNMHALNGNLDAVHATKHDRTEVVDFCRTLFWDSSTIQVESVNRPSSNVAKLLRNMPYIYYCRDSGRGSQVPVIAGTLHQSMVKWWEDIDEQELAEIVDSGSSGAEERGSTPTSRHEVGFDKALGTSVGLRQEEGGENVADRLDTSTGEGRSEDVCEGMGHERDDDDVSGASFLSSDEESLVISKDDPPIVKELKLGLLGVASVAKEGRKVKGGRDKKGSKFSRMMQALRRTAKVVSKLATENVEGGLCDVSSKGIQVGDRASDAGWEPAKEVGQWMSHFRKATKHLKWIGVGTDSRKNHGELERTGAGEKMIDAATNPQPATPGLINPSKGIYTFGFLSNTTLLAAAVDRAITGETHDYRVLALKVDLYDELRERRIVQPTGVDYAWAGTDQAEPITIHLCQMGGWHYDAIFLTMDVLEVGLRRGGLLKVGSGNEEEWGLNGTDVRIIPLGENMDPGGKGRDMWILSHLTYPLSWVIDTCRIYRLGGSSIGEEEMFIRTAGLVDIHDKATKIIFLVPSKSASSVTLGGRTFPVVTTDHRGELPANTDVPVYSMDDVLCNILDGVLNYTHPLREAFNAYVLPYFPRGINWLEINSLSIALTVRWHQKIEGVKEAEGRITYVGAPKNVLESLDLLPREGIRNTSYPEYGGRSSVNGLDQRFIQRQKAREACAAMIGNWGNMASIAVATGFATFNTRNAEDEKLARARCFSGGVDRLIRGGFLRKAFEIFKRAAAYTERIAFPATVPNALRYWASIIRGHEDAGFTVEWFTKMFITPHVIWNWNANVAGHIGGVATLTGIRGPSSWNRSVLNTEWSEFTMSGRDTDERDIYVLDDTQVRWTYNYYCQVGQGEDVWHLEQALGRLDLIREDPGWGFKYQTHPRYEPLEGYVFVVDYSNGAAMAREHGWAEEGSANPELDKWGWGLQVRIKDFRAEQLKTLVIPAGTAGVLCARQYGPRTILYRGSRDRGVTGIRQHYLDRPMGLDAAKLERRALKDAAAAGDGKPSSREKELTHEETIIALEKKLAELKAARAQELRAGSNEEEQKAPLDEEKDRGAEKGTGKAISTPSGVKEPVPVQPDLLQEHGVKGEQSSLEQAAERRGE